MATTFAASAGEASLKSRSSISRAIRIAFIPTGMVPPSRRIRSASCSQSCVLLNQEVAHAVQKKRRLLSGRLGQQKQNRLTRDRFAAAFAASFLPHLTQGFALAAGISLTL
jgi:hypothetical protein